MTGQREKLLGAALDFLGAPRFVTALTTAIVGVAVLAFPIRQLSGWAGLIGALSVLVLLAAASLIARWGTLEWRGLLPLSLLVFLGWTAITLVWSQYQWVSLAALIYLLAFTVLAFYVALLRDTIQIVRAFGDVLRLVLGISIGIEILSGVLIDAPIRFLSVQGNLADLGPIQGILGNRNDLGIVAVIALITFGAELATKSVPRGLAIGSLIGAALCVLLTRSPITIGVVIVVAIATGLLYALRRAPAENRRYWQFALLGVLAIGLVLAWVFRSAIITVLGATEELTYRLDVWYRAFELISLHPLEGWGWIGAWRIDLPPFNLFADISPRFETTASGALVDLWLQLGLVGLVIFLALAGLAVTRSWLLASARRSVVYVWPALVLIALLVNALAESSILVEFGWLAFVVCIVKAANQLSWRQAFARLDNSEPNRDG
ncbi:O-antigen ligase [Microbacteriaceae bacterium SG_E_30_P1]|uniref:O-antigen ligase n=1 Tax=Antiquaquibacter oligotrophicus TaxID=2880260 RepID=A0ABT6KR65_9MICO|nr:O-antigen ligase family protein [Antiquaquibacter oligotrophicus]MDH6181697.1 O-antigen ligase [Antiquaquibacter oligotrophicus]UDF12619.1 O-antigen ligase family protein [Antiquaquibacter oligotrophicus]